MRYLVTGGRRIYRLKHGGRACPARSGVVVLDDLSSGKEENLADIRNKITFMKGSITDLETVPEGHAASRICDPPWPPALLFRARSRIPRNQPASTLTAPLNVLLAARDNKVKRVVFAASSSLPYGETPRFPQDGKTCSPPLFSPYGSRNT